MRIFIISLGCPATQSRCPRVAPPVATWPTLGFPVLIKVSFPICRRTRVRLFRPLSHIPRSSLVAFLRTGVWQYHHHLAPISTTLQSRYCVPPKFLLFFLLSYISCFPFFLFFSLLPPPQLNDSAPLMWANCATFDRLQK